MPRAPSRQRAQELIAEMSRQYGYIDHARFEHGIQDPVLRRDIEEALLLKDKRVGSSIITLARNLYTNKARFMFELLQNADDNHYTRAGVVPSISFHVYPHQIVLECNEDGFDERNLHAICTIGESSKKAANQDYIGEKGIGFKSVFMVASKVHIQSGALSFSFQHTHRDSGLGMVCPRWEEPDEGLDPEITRMTLHLLRDEDGSVQERVRADINDQFSDIQETFLLFMKNLKKVEIAFYGQQAQRLSMTTYAIEATTITNRHIITKSTVAVDTSVTQEVKHFHRTDYRAAGIPSRDNRNCVEGGATFGPHSMSQVCLAFPLSEDLVPIVEPQKLFAFLPVREVGFNFIIHADFVTDASREDVVQDAHRNRRLVEAIGSAFAVAVQQLCSHPESRYTWMRYLPDTKNKAWGPLWAFLADEITNSLHGLPVLYTRGDDGDLCSIVGSLRPDQGMLDENGDSLLEETKPRRLISKLYAGRDLQTLQRFGLEFAQPRDFISWLHADLQKGALSRMMSSQTKEDWHTRVAQYLNHLIATKPSEYLDKLKEMRLLPLDFAFNFFTTSVLPVYFSQTAGVEIPSHILFSVISKKVKNSERLALFKALGVGSAPVELVRQAIFKQDNDRLIINLSIKDSRRHFEFLYLTEKIHSADISEYSRLSLPSSRGKLMHPSKVRMYIVSDEVYGPWMLTRAAQDSDSKESDSEDGDPGMEVYFVHEEYLNPPCDTPKDYDLTWLEWFYERLHVRKYLEFLGPNGQLSEEAIYLQKHKTEAFIGALFLWYQQDVELSSTFIKLLRETQVLCEGGYLMQLKDTYFPTAALQRKVQQLIGPDTFFPWLFLDTDHIDFTSQFPWELLVKVAGENVSELSMALDMMDEFLNEFLIESVAKSTERLFDLYHYIQSKYRESDDRAEAAKQIREVFGRKKWIFVPLSSDNYEWVLPSDCVWSDQFEMKTKFALPLLYDSFLGDEDMGSTSLAPLFTHVLGVQDCTWQTYVEELEELRDTGCDDIDAIAAIYEELDRLSIGNVTFLDDIRAAFAESALIYLPTEDGQAWHMVSDCVWSGAATLRGKLSLNAEYEDLKEFFVGCLGVKPVDLSMAIEKLQQTGSRQTVSPQEVTDSIWTVNSLLLTEPNPPSSRSLAKSKIFPIKTPGGDITCVAIDAGFSVVDREPLRRWFAHKAKFLAFTLEETALLRPFIQWTGLDNRYVSRNVKEITSVYGGLAQLTLNPERQIWNRAYALLRIASHFDSPRTRTQGSRDSFYDMLMRCEIRETDVIATSLSLRQGEEQHLVEVETTTLALDDSDSILKVYVPRKKDDQEYTFTNLLARKLFDWMMQDAATKTSGMMSEEGINATRDILLAPRAKIALSLEHNGIATIDRGNQDDIVKILHQATLDIYDGSTVREDETIADRDSADFDDGSSISRTAATGVASQRQESRSSPARVATSSGQALDLPIRSLPVAADTGYLTLLSRAIAAGRRGTIPKCLEFDELRSKKGLKPVANLQYANRTERNEKIAAAGELYVYELLSHPDLPGGALPDFTMDNWQSNLRGYVSLHPDYAALRPWGVQETSDIVYTDSQGALTQLLISKGYLEAAKWEKKHPKYYIEVKTTLSSCEASFSMTKDEFARMRNCALEASNDHTIYAIFRVYNLGWDNTSLQIYIDPEAMRDSGKLVFTEESWSIVPRRRHFA